MATNSVSVRPEFVKQRFFEYHRTYVRAVEMLQGCCCSNEAPPHRPPKILIKDLQSDNFHILFRSLELLENVTQLMCSCVPSGGIVGDAVLAQRVSDFICLVNAMLGPVHDQSECADLVQRFDVAKRTYQYRLMLQQQHQECSVNPIIKWNPSTEWASKIAFECLGDFKREHFLALVEFAYWLARLCQYMAANMTKPAGLSSFQDWQRLLPSVDYLCVSLEHV